MAHLRVSALAFLQGLDLLLHSKSTLPVILVAEPELSIRRQIERLSLLFEVEIGGVAPHHGIHSVGTHVVISVR